MSSDESGSIAHIGEFGLIERITADLPEAAEVEVGPGDDAAVVVTPDGRVVITVDLQIEGRHFKRDWSTPMDIGRKAVAASLADIAAMGGQATAVVVGLAVPADTPAAWAIGLSAGMRAEAEVVGAHLVGGDTVESDVTVISVTAIGDLAGRKPVRRSGAKPGNVVAVSGRLGWSMAGLAVLSRGFRSPKVLVDAHRCPTPPYSAGPQAARAGATAMIDVSDGLIADVRHLAEASGVVIDIDPDAFEVPQELADAAAAYNIDPLEWMLTGGEDHALVATFPKGKRLPKGYVKIGTVLAAEDQPGVSVKGARITKTGGHEHFV